MTFNSNQLPTEENDTSVTWEVEDGSDRLHITLDRTTNSVVGWIIEYDEEIGDWVDDDSLSEDDLKDTIIRFDLRCKPYNQVLTFD